MEALGGLVTLVALYMKDPEQVSRESSVPSAVPQPVVAQLTRAAIFLVVTVNSGKENEAAVRAFCGDLAALLRAVGFRDLEGRLSCVVAFGSDVWDRLFGAPKPKELHTEDFAYKGHVHHASEDDPQYEIKSDKTDHIVAHKGSALEHTPE
jgi:porphyrinogen peroxidase